MKMRRGDQPLPDKNDRTPMQDLLIADIEKRKVVGIERYGTLLQPFNNRSFVRDAYEETIDLSLYLRGVMEEAHEILCLTIPAEGGRQFPTRAEFERCLSLLAHLSGREQWDFLKQCPTCQGREEVPATPGSG